MKVAILATVLGLVASQQRTCVYTDQNGRYQLNLTRESDWTLEVATGGRKYYYTPCRNGIQCRQGNANFYSNVADYGSGNTCIHYLGVDHHESPEYSFYGASWRFEYEDGEICDVTQQPRRTIIYYHCNEEYNSPITLYDVNEPQPCTYLMDIRGNAACVPENSHNANCQWRTPNPNNASSYYYLDLSALNNETIYSRLPNGYYHTITPCRNDVYCYQQYGTRKVMGVIDNHVTNTCEHYGAIWEDGRVQPILHNVGTSQEHWSFHYFNGQECSDGTLGEEEFRFYCDPNVSRYQVINTTGENCRFDINIATQYACTSNALKHQTPLTKPNMENIKKFGAKVYKKLLDRLQN